MASLFEMITFVESGDVLIRMSLFELLATITVLLNVWLYGRLSIWGPRLGVVGCVMWIVMAARVDPQMWGLIILNVILMSQNVWNHIKWSRNNKLAAAAAEQGDHETPAA
ncbi:MAG: nicotinamide mononucleotide transporter [Alphaproteobacteria bacterium]|nr:nicotinamide mononucleotide transporter [Alphaproteobacteria bacterium]